MLDEKLNCLQREYYLPSFTLQRSMDNYRINSFLHQLIQAEF